MGKIRNVASEAWEKALLRGFFAPLAFLTSGALLVVLVSAVALSLLQVDVNSSGEGFWELTWEVLLRAMSPDQLTNQDTWAGRFSLLIVTLFGLLIVSTLISISNVAVAQRLDSLRKGKKPVNLSGHIALINWNDFGFRVLRELAEANSSISSTRKVVILCDEDPLELRNAIRANFSTHIDRSHPAAWWLKHPDAWISIRRGLGHHTDDLRQLSAIDQASGVIVFQKEDADEAQALRSVLAINAVLRSQSDKGAIGQASLPVVTFNPNTELVHTLDRRLDVVANSTVPGVYRKINYIPLSPEEIRAGIETQVARHRGLSAVYQDLLDFGGEELYIVEPPSGVQTFGEYFQRATEAVPIGVLDNGLVDLWPNWSDSVVGKSVIVLATDRPRATQLKPDVRPENDLGASRVAGRKPRSQPENFLFIGWSSSAEELRIALPKLLPVKSSLTVLLRTSQGGPLDLEFGTSSINVIRRGLLDPLDEPDFLSKFHHVVVFADMETSAQTSDAQVLTDLIMCRHYADAILDKSRRFTIVGELRRRSSRYVAGVRLADDLLISDSLMAAAATQLVLQPELESVLSSLLSVEDPVEIITVPLDSIGEFPLDFSWANLQHDVAMSTGEIALGYREDVNGEGRVVLNPPREKRVPPSAELIVLSRASTTI